jgi:Glycosyl hydrolase family 65, N-terminal domain
MRRYASAEVSLEDVMRACEKFDVTINDVALAAITDSFRAMLVRRGHQPKANSVRTLVPVSVRSNDALDETDNRVLAMLPYLPVEKADPLEQLRTVHRRLARTKASGQRQAAGVYNLLTDQVAGTTIDNESLVNLPNWLPLTFRIDGGSWFDIDKTTPLSYLVTIDLRRAVLTRELRFRHEEGRTTAVKQRRFAAMHLPHVGAMETTITAENWSGNLEFRSLIDGDVENLLVERYRELSSRHLDVLELHELAPDSVQLVAETVQSNPDRGRGTHHCLARRCAHDRRLPNRAG